MKGALELRLQSISLIGGVYKIVAKFLAERIRFVTGKLVSGKQNAFLKDGQNKCNTSG